MEGNVLKETQKKGRGLIWISDRGLIIYLQGIGILQFLFTERAVANMEILDPLQFSSEVKTFFQANQIAPTTFGIVVGNEMVFEKIIQNKNQEASDQLAETPEARKQNQLQEIKTFLETVPFESVVSIKMTVNEGLAIIATNKDFISHLRSLLIELGFAIDFVIPAIVIGNSIDFSNGINDSNAASLFSKKGEFSKYSLLQEEIQSVPYEQYKQKTDSARKRLVLLLGVFGVLILVLAYMVFTMVL